MNTFLSLYFEFPGVIHYGCWCAVIFFALLTIFPALLAGDESNDKSYKKSPEYKDKDNSDSEPNSSNADASVPKKRKRVARACA
jgi:hypothetical protein